MHEPFIQLQSKHCTSYAEADHGGQTSPGLLAPFTVSQLSFGSHVFLMTVHYIAIEEILQLRP